MYIFFYKTDKAALNKTARDCSFLFFYNTLHLLQKQPKKKIKGTALDGLNTAYVTLETECPGKTQHQAHNRFHTWSSADLPQADYLLGTSTEAQC